MSFRLKTIIGIALIEGSLLLFLVWSGVDYLMQSNQDELAIRAQTTSESFANLTRDAVLSTDLARLESVARRAMYSSDMVYVRFMDAENILVEAGDKQALARPFTQDSRLDEASDGVFDVGRRHNGGGRRLRPGGTRSVRGTCHRSYQCRPPAPVQYCRDRIP